MGKIITHEEQLSPGHVYTLRYALQQGRKHDTPYRQMPLIFLGTHVVLIGLDAEPFFKSLVPCMNQPFYDMGKTLWHLAYCTLLVEGKIIAASLRVNGLYQIDP